MPTVGSSVPAGIPGKTFVSFDSYAPEGEKPILYNISDVGCPVSRTCLDCPLVVCKHDPHPSTGGEYGAGRAIRKTWPNGDWPERLNVLAFQGVPRDHQASPAR
jgi:hypothetical protein